MFMPTVRETFNAGQLIRLWCFRCGRGDIMTPAAMKRYWTCDLRTWHPLCGECMGSDQTIALPARDTTFVPAVGNANTRLGEAYYHMWRKKGRP